MVMKSLYKILAVACLVLGFAACDRDQLTGESIFIDPVIDTTTYTYQFDKWLDKYQKYDIPTKEWKDIVK